MWPIGRPSPWVGRVAELAVFHAAAEALRGGAGSVIWVEGEPGIGKSSLVAEALADSDPAWDIGWGMADQLTERLPLRVILDCLQVRPGSPDPRRAHAAELLRYRQLSLLAGDDASAAGLEVLVALVDELCAAAPTVLVIDDLQWADEASLVVWHRLATSISQLRLLLIGTCRPTPRRPEVQRVRTAVARRGGALITLSPLAETDVNSLVTAMVGAPPGDGLRRLTAQAAGNPLYVRELIDALVREQAVEVRPVAEVALAAERLPASLAGVLTDRLSWVSPETAQLLRAAALLGGRFTATDLAVVLRQPVSDLAAGLQEAVAAAIFVGSGAELVFRHPLIRQALYESMPLALRTALHAEAARELATAGADALSVAQQLSAAGRPGAGWAGQWLLQAASALATRAPQLAVELLRRELDEAPAGAGTRDSLMASLTRAQLAAGSYQDAAGQASRALTVMTDPVVRAETSWMLARAQVSTGDNDDAIATIGAALAEPDLPGKWRARILALLPMLQRVATGHLDTVEATARQALAVAGEADDPVAAAHALADLWLTYGVRRDHAAALDYLDRALLVLGDDPGHQDMRLYVLNVRVFTLQNLSQWPQAELALRQAREFALRTGIPDRSTWANAAVLRYWLGQWDDALAELGSDDAYADGYLRERWPALLIHGVAALIAGRRDQRATADQELRKGLALPVENLTDRENQDFLVAAHALALEQRGETRQAMLRLAGMLPRRDGEMTLTHQWLPDLVRLALAAGDTAMAQAAALACQAEAAAETRPARAAAASLRCYGLLESDPGSLAEAVAHYRTAGPAVELPAALEDLAVVLAARGHEADARAALNEAVSLYEGMQARWDIRRAERRLRPFGIKRGVRGRRVRRAATGWEALTPTEVRVATLVAQGDSTSDIAQGMFLSRRTVQTYISRILAKLDAKSRVEIVREALRQGVTP
jgi:DNA-binding CsgD family transcriptional regulator/tetratricopeptide (TPR) repeat protein